MANIADNTGTLKTATAHTSPRRRDLDWLRNLAVLMLIPFHAARIFDVWEPFYVKNGQLSNWLSYYIAFVSPWYMPLLFLVAGAATWFALGAKSPGQYLGERFRRLFIPLLFGLLIIVPPQAYLALLRNPGYKASYFGFLGGYFRDFHDLTGYFGSFTPGHLWFILFLFLIACLALPLLRVLKSERGRRWLSGLVDFFANKPGMIFLLALPLYVIQGLPGIGGKNFFFFLLLFLYGFMLMSDPAWQQALHRHRRIALAVGLLGGAGMVWISLQGYKLAFWSAGNLLIGLLQTAVCWCWLIALLAYGHKYLNRGGAVLRYANEAAYPFYILHQTVLLAVGWFAVRCSMGVPAKFALVCVLSALATLAVYELLVRRIGVFRYLFGMKVKTGQCNPPA